MFKKRNSPVNASQEENALARHMMEQEEKRKLEEQEKAIFSNAIYLIKSNWLKLDVTYKVVHKDDFIYFCRCGGQFYNIDLDIAMNTTLSEKELLIHKNSFRLKKDEIKSVNISSKIRFWTGGIPNMGSVEIVTEEKLDFIIHAVNDYPQVQAFFSTALSCPVTVHIDMKREQEDSLEAEFDKQDNAMKNRSKKIVGFLNTAGMISGLWLFIFPHPIHLAVSIGLMIPIVSLLFYMFNNRLVSFDDSRTGVIPSIATAFIMPSAGLGLAGVTEFNIEYGFLLLALSMMVTAIISIVVLRKRKEYKRQKSLLFFIPFFILTYSFGAIITTNCVFDYHTSTQYHTKTLDKQYDEDDRTNKFTIVIESWRQGKKPVDVPVSKSIYQASEIGQDMLVDVFPGLWGIEWYSVQPQI